MTPEQRTALAAPFTNVQWRVAKKMKNNDKRGEVVCYIDARDVMDRLDAVFGDDGWSFDWQPIATGKDSEGEYLRLAKGILTIGGISRSDIGEAGNYEKSKAAVSDALKRAAVHFGIARYLYEMPAQWADLDQYGSITKEAQAKLDATLAAFVQRTFGTQVARQQATQDAPEEAATQAKPKPAMTQRGPVGLAAKQHLVADLCQEHGITKPGLMEWMNDPQRRYSSQQEAHLDAIITALQDDQARHEIQFFALAQSKMLAASTLLHIMRQNTRNQKLTMRDAWVAYSYDDDSRHDWDAHIANEATAYKKAS